MRPAAEPAASRRDALDPCRLLLRVGGLAVPRSRRVDWRNEWWAELVWCHDRLRQRGALDALGRAGLVAQAAGCLLDALVLRLERTRQAAIRNRAAVRRLGRTPGRSGAVVLAQALPLILAAAAAATLLALAGRGHDLRLVVGVVAFGGLALLLAIAAAAAARRALPPGRVLRDTALGASLGVALVLAPVAARLLTSAVAFVGQDPVAAPTPLGVAAVVGMLVVIALRMRSGPRSARPSPWSAPLLLAALLSGGTALGLLDTRRQAAAIELGFDLAGLATVRVELPGGSDASPEALLAALRASPGVLAASATTLAPLSRLGNELARLSDSALGAGPVPVVARGISSGYHRSLGLEVVAPPTGGGLLVNRALARRLGGATPLGLRLRVDGSEAVVVGVAPDIQHFDPEDPIVPVLYYPLPQRARAFDVLVRVAAEGDRMSYFAVEERIRSLLPGAVVRRATPIGELHRSRLAWRSFAAALLGLTALSSAAIGLLLGGVRARSVAVPLHLSREVPRG